MSLKNDWQEADIVMNTDMNDIANEVNAKLNSDFSNVSGGAVPISNGGTGATTSENAKNNLGLGTSDTPTFNALNLTNTTVNGNKIYNSGSNMIVLQREICAGNKGYLVYDNDWGYAYFGSHDLNSWTQTGIFAAIGGEAINIPQDTDGWGLIEVLRRDGWLLQRGSFVNKDYTTYERQGHFNSETSTWEFGAWEKRTPLCVQEQEPPNAANLTLWAW